MFQTIKYMHWIKTVPDVSINLTGSGVASPEYLSDLNIPSSDIPLGEANWYGYEPLKEWLANKYKIDTSHIAITPGASMANYIAINALAGMVDEFCIETPSYEPHIRIAEGVGYSKIGIKPMQISRLNRDASKGYKLGSDIQLPMQNSTALIISNPNNPTGVFDSDETTIRLADQVSEYGGYLMVDEVFRPFIEGEEFCSPASLHDRIVSTCSLTKAWGLYGLRIGWVIGNPDIIQRISGIMDNLHVIQPVITEYIALHTLVKSSLASDFLIESRRMAKSNFEIVAEYLGNCDQLSYTQPDGGITMLIRFKDGSNSDEYCLRLMEDEDVLVAPGRFFEVYDGFRLSFGIDPAMLRKGLESVVRLASDD